MVSVLLPTFLSGSTFILISQYVCVFVWKSVCMSLIDNYWILRLSNLPRWSGSDLAHIVLMCRVSLIWLLSSIFIISTRRITRDYSQSFSSDLICNPWFLERLVLLPFCFTFCFITCYSAEGPKSPVAKGGVELWLHPAGLRWQHRHRAPFRPHGQRTLRHSAGNSPSKKKKKSMFQAVCVSQSENQHLPVLSVIPLLAQDPSAQPCKYHSQSYSMISISIVSSIFSDDRFGYSMLYLNWMHLWYDIWRKASVLSFGK